MEQETETNTSESTQVAPLLPGESAVDSELLDRAVEAINHTYVGKGLEMAREIGEYVLRTFFDHDLGKFRSTGQHHITFRALGEREDLHVSYVFIWRAVNVVDQLRLLPDKVARVLPYTHHALLIPLRSEETKVTLATKAVDESWTKRRLEAEVRKARKKETGGSRSGRPPLPAFVKTVNRLEKLVRTPEAHFGDTDQIAEMDPEEAKRLLDAIVALKEQLDGLQEQLEGRL